MPDIIWTVTEIEEAVKTKDEEYWKACGQRIAKFLLDVIQEQDKVIKTLTEKQ